MITIAIRHKVEDFERWKQVFDAGRAQRIAAGEIRSRVYSVHGSPNDVLVSLDWSSLEQARAFVSSPQLTESMTRAGVREMPSMVIMDKRDEHPG